MSWYLSYLRSALLKKPVVLQSAAHIRQPLLRRLSALVFSGFALSAFFLLLALTALPRDAAGKAGLDAQDEELYLSAAGGGDEGFFALLSCPSLQGPCSDASPHNLLFISELRSASSFPDFLGPLSLSAAAVPTTTLFPRNLFASLQPKNQLLWLKIIGVGMVAAWAVRRALLFPHADPLLPPQASHGSSATPTSRSSLRPSTPPPAAPLLLPREDAHVDENPPLASQQHAPSHGPMRIRAAFHRSPYLSGDHTTLAEYFNSLATSSRSLAAALSLNIKATFMVLEALQDQSLYHALQKLLSSGILLRENLTSPHNTPAALRGFTDLGTKLFLLADNIGQCGALLQQHQAFSQKQPTGAQNLLDLSFKLQVFAAELASFDDRLKSTFETQAEEDPQLSQAMKERIEQYLQPTRLLLSDVKLQHPTQHHKSFWATISLDHTQAALEDLASALLDVTQRGIFFPGHSAKVPQTYPLTRSLHHPEKRWKLAVLLAMQAVGYYRRSLAQLPISAVVQNQLEQKASSLLTEVSSTFTLEDGEAWQLLNLWSQASSPARLQLLSAQPPSELHSPYAPLLWNSGTHLIRAVFALRSLQANSSLSDPGFLSSLLTQSTSPHAEVLALQKSRMQRKLAAFPVPSSTFSGQQWRAYFVQQEEFAFRQKLAELVNPQQIDNLISLREQRQKQRGDPLSPTAQEVLRSHPYIKNISFITAEVLKALREHP